MRTGAARGHVGHFHEAGFYGSDAEFRSLIVPFAEEGVAAGEPVIIGYDDRKSGLLRSWLTDPSAVEFIGDKSLYATPARAIATYRRLFEFHVAMGARQIRIAGDVPHPGNGARFEGWDLYESAVNTVWQDFPVWGRCLYDTATAPQAVLNIVERTHPRIVSPTGDHRAACLTRWRCRCRSCSTKISAFPTRPSPFTPTGLDCRGSSSRCGVRLWTCLKTRRQWIWAMQLLLGAALAGVALSIPATHFFQCTLAFFWLLAFNSATHDIAADGFYMLATTKREQAFFSGIRNTFYRVAMITAQGGLIIIAGKIQERKGSFPFAWSIAFTLVAATFLCLGLYHRHPLLRIPARVPEDGAHGVVGLKESVSDSTSSAPACSNSQSVKRVSASRP